MYAVVDGIRVKASPSMKGVCPVCQSEVISKCGEIKIWHWAHKVQDCDLWHENESKWHIDWKSKFPEEWREVTIGKHRADVKTEKLVLELQSSSISSEEIRERELFYGKMIWLVNAEDFWDNLRKYDHGGWSGFYWKWARKSWLEAKYPIVLDTSDGLFLVKKLGEDGRKGWGRWLTEKQFISMCCSTEIYNIDMKSEENAESGKVFFCNYCKKRFIGTLGLGGIYYRIPDNCEGTDDDLVEFTDTMERKSP